MFRNAGKYANYLENIALNINVRFNGGLKCGDEQTKPNIVRFVEALLNFVIVGAVSK